MINSSEPNSQGETIPGLPQDLQMIGRYIKRRIDDLEFAIADEERELQKLEADPSEAELDLEEEAEILGLEGKDAEAWKAQGIDTEELQKDIESLKKGRESFLDMLEDLKKGEVSQCINFLQNRLNAMERSEGLITYEGTTPQYKERFQAEKRALGQYIALLESKKQDI